MRIIQYAFKWYCCHQSSWISPVRADYSAFSFGRFARGPTRRPGDDVRDPPRSDICKPETTLSICVKRKKTYTHASSYYILLRIHASVRYVVTLIRSIYYRGTTSTLINNILYGRAAPFAVSYGARKARSGDRGWKKKQRAENV